MDLHHSYGQLVKIFSKVSLHGLVGLEHVVSTSVAGKYYNKNQNTRLYSSTLFLMYEYVCDIRIENA
jgi:hypothetical protein